VATRLALAALLLVAPLGCASRNVEQRPAPRQTLAVERLEQLADDFYRRLTNRRFNSIATFQDPGLREFFHSAESFSDYYADLAQSLEFAYFEASRPIAVDVLGLIADGHGRVLVQVRFTGKNGLPLRWWNTRLLREDRWQLGGQGRWWIMPGKV
jgi:hypothetical protein